MENQPIQKNEQKTDYAKIFFLLGTLTAWIVIPLLVARFIGFWLDKKFNTAPWLFLACVAIAFLISMIGIVKKAKQFMNKI